MDTIIEILIDYSNSMGSMKGTDHQDKYLLPDGTTRMTLQKKVILNEVLPLIDYATKVIIRVFYSKNSKLQAPILYSGKFHLKSLEKVISQIVSDPQKTGGTPITSALVLALADLLKEKIPDRKIILLTDGQETDIKQGESYVTKAKEVISKYNLKCKIFIIGLNQDINAENKAKELVYKTDGAYINLNSNNYDPNTVAFQLAPLKKAIILDTIESIKSIKPLEKEGELSDNITILEEKIIKIESITSSSALSTKIENIERKIQSQIDSTQALLNELVAIKSQILQPDYSNIKSTTLTIDKEYSEEIRIKSEQFIYDFLLKTYPDKKVVWLNLDGESYLYHDFEILNNSNDLELIIECKGTSGLKKTFYMTDYEWEYFLENKNIYQIIRVYNTDNSMTYEVIENLYESIMIRKIVPYLLEPEILKERRVFLTIID